MEKIFLLLMLLPSLGFSQKYLKDPESNNVFLTITPLVYDPNMDSTITHIEFWQDTTSGVKYEEKIYAIVHDREKKKYADGAIDWPILGVGFIGDYRIGNSVSIIIKSYHKDGTTKTFTYREKIKNLLVYNEFEWAMYTPDADVVYDEEYGIYGQ